MRAALYTRVSTEDQAKDGFSLAAQRSKLRAYTKIHGLKVAGEYVDDGQSGRTIKRPAYAKMMAEKDQWDTLIVLKLDRIHRNSRNFMAMMDALEEDGKQFASVMESLDTGTAMGRFVADIIQRIAQLESDQTGERTFIGMEQKAKEGAGGLGGPAPFGYRWHEGQLVIEPTESVAVRRIFHLKARGPSRIARILNEEGHRTRLGKPFDYWNVKAILKSPVYRGHLMWGGIMQRSSHEAYCT